MLGNTFRITLDHIHSQDSHGHRLKYVEGTRADLEESGEPLRLNTGVLDQAILEAASNPGKGVTPLDYLLGCWKRVSRQFKALKRAGEQDQKLQVVREARRLCMSYCIFAVTMPDMFGSVDAEVFFWKALLNGSQLRASKFQPSHATPSGRPRRRPRPMSRLPYRSDLAIP